MNLFRIILLCSLFSIAYTLKAQSVKGMLINEHKEAVPYVNVVLYQDKDSTFVSGTITNLQGAFSIDHLEQGDYRLVVSGVGYQTYQTRIQLNHNDVLDIGNLTLHQENITLNEVVITSKQNPLTMKQGKYTLNVSKSLLKNQPSSLDVLSFLPGVLFVGGQISVIGKGKPLIILNGREIRSQSELEVLQPEQIKEVSIDTHPSAEYGSQYNSVILITTITSLKDYVSSQLTHNSTFARRYSNREGINTNILHGKWSHFISYRFNDNRSKESANNQYRLYDASTYGLISKNSSDNYASGHSNIHNVIFSTTYKLNEKNSFNLQYTLDADNGRSNANTDECTLLDDQTIVHTTDQHIKDKSQIHNIELMYSHKNERGNSLSLSGGYIYSKNTLGSLINTDGNLFNQILGDNNYKVATLKVDYKRNIFGNYGLQLGGKYVNTNNTGCSDSFNPLDGSYFYKDKTSLKDGLLAGYLMVDRQFQKLYVSAGIRGEYINANYSQNGENLYKENDFTLYPSIDLEYSLSPNCILVGGYNNKSKRPSFSQLSPIIRYINAMLYEKGNPTLKIMNSHNIYLACVLHRKFSVEASYTSKKNFSMYVFQPDAQLKGSLVNAPINIDVSYCTLSASYSDKWGLYRFAYNGSIQYDVTKVPFLGEKNEALHPRFFLSTVNQFDVYKKTMLFCDFNITSKFNSLGTEMKPAYALSLGIMKTFFKDNRLQVVISFNDILHKMTANSTSNINNVWSQKILDPDSRNINISIKYNLNNFKNIFQRNKGNAEELNRIIN